MNATEATYIMLAMLAASLVTDLRAGKIYNFVTAPCALAGLALGFIAGGLAGAGDRLLGMTVVLIAVVLLSPLVKLGGGDTKLLMAVGALQGFQFAIWAMLLTGVSGGVLALALLAKRRMMKQTASNMLTNMVSTAAGAPVDLATGSAVGKMQYSFAITLGALAALVLGAWSP
jgi:prepilin peptidase CpaA